MLEAPQSLPWPDPWFTWEHLDALGSEYLVLGPGGPGVEPALRTRAPASYLAPCVQGHAPSGVAACCLPVSVSRSIPQAP